MITVSQTYTDIISAGGAYEWQVINGANTWTIENLVQGSLSMSFMDGLSIGNCIASQLDLTLWNVSPDTSNPLVLQFRANDGISSTSSWYTKGTFYIDTVDASPYSEYTEITAFDAMLKSEVPYLESGTWTATTDYAVLQAIASDIGVSIDTATASVFSGSPITLNEAPNLGTDGTTEQQMLSAFAAMRGGNFIISSDNKLKLICPYSTPSNTVAVGDSVDDFEATPSETVKRVRVWLTNSAYYYAPSSSGGTDLDLDGWEALGGYCIEVSIPFWGSQTIADSILTSYNNKTFYPYTGYKAFIDPKYEIGDGATFKTSNTVTSLLVTQTMDIGWLAPSSVEFKGEDLATPAYPYISPVEREVSQNAKAIASIQVQESEILSTVSEVENNVTVLQTQVTQNASGISAVNSRIDGQESYIRWDGSTSTVSIGASDAPTEAQIDPNGFAVVQNGETILEAKGHHVTTTHFEATASLTVGRYQWIDEGSNGYSLMYVGS